MENEKDNAGDWEQDVRRSFYESQPVAQNLNNMHNESPANRLAEQYKKPEFIASMLRFIASVCAITEGEGVARSMLTVTVSQNSGDVLLNSASELEYEAKKDIGVSTFFREDSYATKFIGLYCRIYGSYWIKNTIGTLISQIEKKVTEDPESWNQRELTELNTAYLVTLVGNWIDRIIEGLHSLPPEIILAFRDFVSKAKKVGIEKAINLVGSVFFLRFVNTSITNPQLFALTKQPQNEFRKALTWIGKIMQNIANGTVPSVKQPNLRAFDEIAISNNERFLKAFDTLLKEEIAMKSNDSISLIPSKEYVVGALEHLIKYIISFWAEAKKFFGDDAPNQLAFIHEEGFEAADKKYTRKPETAIVTDPKPRQPIKATRDIVFLVVVRGGVALAILLFIALIIMIIITFA